MNSISSIALHVQASDELFIRNWYRDFELFAEKHITAVADRVLMRCDQQGFEIEVSRLDLDLGVIPEEDFEKDFERLLEEKLEESLIKEILYPSRKEDKRLEEADYQLEALKQFLLHGTLNWNLAKRFKHISDLFREVLSKRAGELSSFLKSYGHFTSLQHRMIYQFEDDNLFEKVRLLAPEEFSFIQSYVTFLRIKYAEVPKTPIREEERRIIVWKVVFAYLLNNQVAAFNKKRFVRDTIDKLAAHVNLDYGALLKTLTAFLDQGSGSVFPSGLQVILQELKQEEQHSFLELRVQKPEEWPHILRELKASKKLLKINRNDLDQLRALLENEQNVLLVIKPLSEPEIFDLVRLLVPSDAPFVIDYAQQLNKQNQSGALQGKSGGDFLVFKWQVILPLLALAKHAPVNREYLVWQVFKRLSARYNVAIWQIITFAYQELATGHSSNGLKALLTQLYRELVQGKPKSEQTQTFDSVSFQIRLLEEKAQWSKEQLKELRSKLSSSLFRELLLDGLKEPARHRLLAIMLPARSSELSAFMQVLNQSANGGKIEGTAMASLRRLKWTFLFDVLEETKNQVFNQEHIVQRVLERTGAHYNLSLKQLVHYFYVDFSNTRFSLPFNLYKTLASIKLKIDFTVDPGFFEDGSPDSKKRAENRKRLIRYFTENEQSLPMIHSISQDLAWMNFLSPILDGMKQLVEFIQRKWNIRINNQLLLQTVFRFSKNASHRSQKELMHELWQLIQKSLSKTQQAQLTTEFLARNQQEVLLKQLHETLEKELEIEPEALEIPEEETTGGNSALFIDNAGMVLLGPFLPRLFTMMELLENGKFKDRDAQIKAIFLMQYAVNGDDPFPEYAVQLNKLLTHFKTGIPIPRVSLLNEADKDTVNGMLKGVLQNWGRLTNTTVEGLQEGFLRREGRLEEQENQYLLTVESKAYDMLLDHVPWNFRTIKYSWMPKPIQVKWR